MRRLMIDRTMLMLTVALIVACNSTLLIAGTDDGEKAAGSSALLFAYTPKEGMERLFEEGYRRHLDWHKEQNDSLTWYAWTVFTGDNIGRFVDGVFGVALQEIDNRVNPAEDAADFAQTSAPFAKPSYRKILRSLPEYSTGQPLEDGSPTRFMQIRTYHLVPGMEPGFEEVLRAFHQANSGKADSVVYSWYKVVDGAEQPVYIRALHINKLADLDAAPVSLSESLVKALGEELADELRDHLAGSVRYIKSELWLYRPDLSYFPGK